MRKTPNYEFRLPDYNNIADVEIINQNFEKVDAELKKCAGGDELKNLLNTKVDKEDGKELSSNDFTDEEKQKLSNLLDQVALDTTLDQKVNKTDIVNDLVTGGTEKVLSAEQGKVLFQSVVDGKGKIATTINDLVGNNVANAAMTHQDLSVVMRNNINHVDPLIIEKLLMKDWNWYGSLTTKRTITLGSLTHPNSESGIQKTRSADFTAILTKGLYVFAGIYSTSYGILRSEIKKATLVSGEKFLWGVGTTSGHPPAPCCMVYVKSASTIRFTCELSEKYPRTLEFILIEKHF